MPDVDPDIVSYVERLIHKGLLVGPVIGYARTREGILNNVTQVRLGDTSSFYVKSFRDHEANSIVESAKSRFHVERNALTYLSTLCPSDDICLPQIRHADSARLMLLLTDASPSGGCNWQTMALNDKEIPIERADTLGKFLGFLRTKSTEIPPLRANRQADEDHADKWLHIRTTMTAKLCDDLGTHVREHLDRLYRAGTQRQTPMLAQLDYCPKNIIVGDAGAGIVDFELASSASDPMLELGILLGHHLMFWLNGALPFITFRDTHLALVRGYERHCPLTRDEGELLCGYIGAIILYRCFGRLRAGYLRAERLSLQEAVGLFAMEKATTLNDLLNHAQSLHSVESTDEP